MQNYVKGDLVRISHVFYDAAGVLVDPGTVTFAYKREADAVTTTKVYPDTVVKDSVGRYHLDIDTSPSGGVWSWRITSATPADADQGQFYVEPANL